jgi:hypothetical protein
MLCSLSGDKMVERKLEDRFDKKNWREIHDILRVQGFNWLTVKIAAG